MFAVPAVEGEAVEVDLKGLLCCRSAVTSSLNWVIKSLNLAWGLGGLAEC